MDVNEIVLDCLIFVGSVVMDVVWNTFFFFFLDLIFVENSTEATAVACGLLDMVVLANFYIYNV